MDTQRNLLAIGPNRPPYGTLNKFGTLTAFV
jgi:hypothetical protein